MRIETTNTYNDEGFPTGWLRVTLGDIGEITAGGTPPTKESDNFGGDIPWITPADLSGYTEKYISRGKTNITLKGLNNSSAKLMPAGTVLFSSRAPIGYVAIAQNPVSTNQGFKSVTPYFVNSDFIYYYLKFAKDLVVGLSSGTTFLEISGSKFAQVPFPLPPLPEQHRIVEKLERLFARLTRGEAALDAAEAALERYRQSVLNMAFKAEDEEGNLKEGWRLVKLGDLANIVVGYVGPIKDFFVDSTEKGVPLISTTHIGENEFLNHDIRFVSHEFNLKNRKSRVIPGDIIIARHGDSGKACILPSTYPEYQVSNAVILRHNSEKVLPEIIIYALTHARQSLQENRVGAVFQVVNTKVMSDFHICIPDLKNQKKLLEKLTKLFESAETLNTAIKRNQINCNLLRQSILQELLEDA